MEEDSIALTVQEEVREKEEAPDDRMQQPV
jgi:hypothetical protein